MTEKYRKLYEEELVKDIMIYTAFCAKDLVLDIPDITDEDIYNFIEINYRNILDNTLESHGVSDKDIDNMIKDPEKNSKGDLETPDSDENKD